MRKLARDFFITVITTVGLAVLYYITLYPVGKTHAFFFFAALGLRSVDLFLRFMRLKKRHEKRHGTNAKIAVLEGALSGWLAAVIYFEGIALLYYA